MRAAARLQETSSRGPSATAASAGGTTGISAVSDSSFWTYVQGCVQAHFQRYPRQPENFEAILETIREELDSMAEDTVLHDAPRVTAMDLKNVFSQRVWTGVTPLGFIEWALLLLGSLSGGRVWADTIQKYDRRRFLPRVASDLPLPMQTTMAGNQYLLLTLSTLTEFNNKSDAKHLVDQLKSIAPPFQLIFTFAGNIGFNSSEASTCDLTLGFWANVTVDGSKVVHVRIAEHTAAGKSNKTAEAAQTMFKNKVSDVLKRAGLKQGNVRKLPKMQINQCDLQYGDITHCLARTASFLFGHKVPTDLAIIALIRPWLYSILTAGSALTLGSRKSPSEEIGPAGGGQSALGEDGRPGPPDAAGKNSRSGTGGDGGDGRLGGDGGHGEGPSGKQVCDVRSQDDVDTESECGDGGHCEGPSGKEGFDVRSQDDDDTGSECDADIQSEEMITIQLQDKNQEEIWKMQRLGVISSIQNGQNGKSLAPNFEKGVDHILELYQRCDYQIVGLKSLGAHTITVLAEYKGDSTGALLHGAKLGIMVSTRWRMKARLKNDPALRQTFNMLEMGTRTKHLLADSKCLNKMEPLRPFNRGATMGLVSSDPILNLKSLVLVFTTAMAHGASAKSLCELLKECVGIGDNGELTLSDELRTRIRQVVFAIKVLHGKGLSLGQAGIESAEFDDDGRVSFPNLSNSVLFPEGNNQYSRQHQTAVQFLNRQNTSLRWDPREAQEGGPSFIATFINDSAVYDVMRKAKQSGPGLGMLQPYQDQDLGCKSATKKDTAFRNDQLFVANLLVKALISTPDSAVIPAGAQTALNKLTKLARNPDEAKAKAAIDGLAGLFVLRGSKVTSTQLTAVCKEQPAFKRLAEFVYKSLRGCTPAEAGYHLFLTACISDPALNIKVDGHGFVVEERIFTLPETWQMFNSCPYLGTLTACPYLGKLLPRVIVKRESQVKGTGVFAGRRIKEGELVMIYLGDFVTDADARPSTRMIVKQTCGEKWV